MEMLILLLNSCQLLISIMPFGKNFKIQLHVELPATTLNSAPRVNSPLMKLDYPLCQAHYFSLIHWVFHLFLHLVVEGLSAALRRQPWSLE